MKEMGKKFFATLIVAVVAMFASYNIYQSQNKDSLSDLALANVEALAGGEIEIGVICVAVCNNCWCGYFPEDFWADGRPYY